VRGRFAIAVGAVLAVGSRGAVAIASDTSGSTETVLSSLRGDMGEQLVVKMNGHKLSLYISISDHGKSTCYGRCAKMWPPLIDRGLIVVANRSCHRGPCYIHQEHLGTVKRKGGSLQVTYHGRPLYRYRRDTETGQVQGQGKNYNWAAITPEGAFYCKGLGICSY
jgi:predicted lipoprotein with Yx(FWY)xxD motif